MLTTDVLSDFILLLLNRSSASFTSHMMVFSQSHLLHVQCVYFIDATQFLLKPIEQKDNPQASSPSIWPYYVPTTTLACLAFL